MKYVTAMSATATEQINRAKNSDIMIHSMSIIPDETTCLDFTYFSFRWPGDTKGKAYSALGYNKATMTAAYQQIAKAYRPILANGVESTQ